VNLRFLLRTLLIAGSLVITVGVFLFTQHLIGRLTEQVTATSRVLARFSAAASYQAAQNPGIRRIFEEVIEFDFPIVITDTTGTPRAWRQVGVDPLDVPAESIDSLVAGMTISPVIGERIARVRDEAAKLDRKNEPIPMVHGSGIRLGEVHYGEPPVLGALRWIPMLSVLGVGLLVFLGLAGLANLRAAERRTIWVGMAKETAHQLGTPLSSLLGWIELLRGHTDEAPDGAVPAAAVREAVDEMQRDVHRLDIVAQRFSRIGSQPVCIPADVRPLAAEVASYMRRRAPSGANAVTIEERYDDVPLVMLNAELIQWALENLVANAVNAFDQKAGRIEIAVARAGEKWVEIAVTDDGRGMSAAVQRRVFEPGYSTKRRGWGLGLPLAQRVVQEYHGGKLFIRRSAPGQGTTMVIRLPVAPASS
jgi:two-component system, NtrC family, sensor histidine kinase KinB